MFPHVLCAVCNKRVDRIEIEEDCETEFFKCTVWCHDHMDICHLAYEVVHDSTGIGAGWAFIDSAKRIHDAGQSKTVHQVETHKTGR